MRPSPSNSSSVETFIILNKNNFFDWEFELENLCLRKDVTDETTKYAWLIKTLNTSDQINGLSWNLKLSQSRSKIKEEDENGNVTWKDVVINGKEKPFTWAVETLRKFFVKGNADSKEKIFVQRESAKDNIKKIRISDCSYYDLDEYYRRFDTSVVACIEYWMWPARILFDLLFTFNYSHL